MNSSEQLSINWATAEVEDGTLTVRLAGEKPKGWAKRFGIVLALLEHGAGGWGDVALHKKRITVSDVKEGSEESLRHLLASLVLQVNSDFEPDLDPDPGDADQNPSASEDDPQSETDQRMTDTFRAFAEREMPAELSPPNPRSTPND